MKYSEARERLRELMRDLTGKEFLESELDDIEYAAVAVRLYRVPIEFAEATASAVVLGCPGAREEAEAFVEEIARPKRDTGAKDVVG